MQDVLVEIAGRLREAPERAAELVLKRGETSDRLHAALDAIKAREAEVAGQVAGEKNGEGKPRYPNEQARQAEIARRLAQDAGYQALRAEADRLRQELRLVDAEAEQVGRRHRSDCQVAYLAASLLGAGLRAETEAVLAAYRTQGRPQAQGREQHLVNFANAVNQVVNGQSAPRAEARAETRPDAEKVTVEVLEVRPGSKEGVYRFWCETDDGRQAVFAKNSVADRLMKSLGRKVVVKAKRLDSGLFAVAVK